MANGSTLRNLESTGHGEEVQGTVRKYIGLGKEVQDVVGKSNARWGRTGHGGEVQDTVGNSRVR